MKLSDIKNGQSAVVVKVLGHGAFRKRMIEMGFVHGRVITRLMQAPLNDPVKFSLMGYEISLRNSEAMLVEVTPISDEQGCTFASIDPSIIAKEETSVTNQESSSQERPSQAPPMEIGKPIINVALIGNPNCGKTSMFNIVSGAHEHVGNYSGVTVDAKTGMFTHGGYRFRIVDLPGTYSLSSYSPEELYVRRYLKDETPDVIINVVVASNLERNLYLTTELIDMDIPMVIALNMYDELEASGDTLDYRLLGDMIGVPVVPTVSRSGEGIDRLFDTVVSVFNGRHESVRHIHVPLGVDIEEGVKVVKDALKADPTVGRHFSPRYLAIKLLERDREAEDIVTATAPEAAQAIFRQRDRQVERLDKVLADDITGTIANEKYGFIAGALAETYSHNKAKGVTATHIIDTFVTSRLFGFPIFLLVMFAIFWATFQIGSYPMEWIEELVRLLGGFVSDYMPDGPLKDLIADGIIGGVGGVIVFLPNILILYFCISFMEDSGYMARAAFIMDRLMHRIGLHGKSFIPLIMGFGCSVPAIMATRTIESRSSRLITILITPFMSCSARLPIYVLLIGTFFSAHAALVFMGLYAAGIIVAMVTARLLRRFWFHADVTPFVMELPPYRVPTLKALLRHMWGKGEQYLRKMGGIILVASIVVWALNYLPLHDEESTAINSDGTSVIVDDSAINPDCDSYLEMMGKALNPVMEPLGFHWRATVAAIAGVPAKEIVVSTLGVLYTGDEEASDATLSARLTAPSPVTHQPDFTPAAALAFMVFILLYCPCIATVTAIVRETGSWTYGAFAVIYNTLAAWLVAFLTYHLALLF